MRRSNEHPRSGPGERATALHLLLEGIRDELVDLGHDEEEVACTEAVELLELRRQAYENLMSAPGA
jgi:hypothetical protein